MQFTNASPHVSPKLKSKYKTPSVFDLSTSKGSQPFEPNQTEIHDDEPANVTPIERVRHMRYVPKWFANVTASPYEEGQWAGRAGKGHRACPYDVGPEWLEWMDGYEDS